MVELTRHENELLESACSGAGEYMCCYKEPHRTGTRLLDGTKIKKGELVGGAMLDAVEQIITDRLAAAMTPIEAEIRDERARAHAKHGDKSIEAWHPADYARLAILTEEVGEVAKEFNEAELGERDVDLAALRKELVQVAAVATAWADAIGGAPGAQSSDGS